MLAFPPSEGSLVARGCTAAILRALPRGPNVFLAGPRQAGKTSVLRLLAAARLEAGADPGTIAYADLEEPVLRRTFDEGVPAVLAHLRAAGFRTDRRLLLLLDEVHLLEDPSNLLKLLADHHPGIRVVFTASSTLAARSRFRDSMAGRHVTFEVLPLSFGESLAFRGIRHFSPPTGGISPLVGGKPAERSIPRSRTLLEVFDDHVRWGGFPAVVLDPRPDGRRRRLDSLIDTYLRRDLRDLFTIESPSGLERLLRAGAAQTAGLLNVNELSRNLGIARPTILRYLAALEATFVLHRLPPYFTNPSKQLVKTPKLHFLDTGLRNRLLDDHRPLRDRPDAGALVESAVYAELRKTLPLGSLFYWRTQSGAEVDFVWRHEGELVPIEVKFSRMARPDLPSGLRAFVEEYRPRRAFVLTGGFEGEVRAGRCRVRFLPAFALAG